MASSTVNMKTTREVLSRVCEEVDEVDGRPHDTEGDNKERMRANAATSRKLLYAAHLAQVVHVSILSEYHRFKGEHPPMIVPLINKTY